MVYPVFEENSIIKRCERDLEQFLIEYPLSENFTLELGNSKYTTFEDMKNAIQPFIQKLEILQKISNKTLFIVFKICSLALWGTCYNL